MSLLWRQGKQSSRTSIGRSADTTFVLTLLAQLIFHLDPIDTAKTSFPSAPQRLAMQCMSEPTPYSLVSCLSHHCRSWTQCC